MFGEYLWVKFIYSSCAHSSEISWANKGPLSFVNYVVIYIKHSSHRIYFQTKQLYLFQNLLEMFLPSQKWHGFLLKLLDFPHENLLINGYGINGTKTEIHTISNFTWNWRIYPDFTTVSHWSRDFVMNNRKLLGLKGTSVWAELHTLPHYWQWTIFLLHFENSVFNSVFLLF